MVSGLEVWVQCEQHRAYEWIVYYKILRMLQICGLQSDSQSPELTLGQAVDSFLIELIH